MEKGEGDSAYSEPPPPWAMTTRRQGKVSNAPILIERRNWYAAVEEENRKKLQDAEFFGERMSISESKQEKLAIETTPSKFADSKSDTLSIPKLRSEKSTVSISESSAKDSSIGGSPPPKQSPVPGFSSMLLDMYEEISAASSTKSYINEKPPPPPSYQRNRRHNIARWVYPLSNIADEAARSHKVLICFHDVGESHTKYLHWARLLPLLDTSVELWGACLPGRALRTAEEYADNILNIAAAIVESMVVNKVVYKHSKRLKRTSKDVYLFGHGLGALVAFEVSRLLILYSEADILNAVFKHLIVSAQCSPSNLSEVNVDQFRFRLSSRPAKELFSHFTNPKNNLNVFPTSLLERKEMISLLFNEMLRSDLQLLEEYYLYPSEALRNLPDLRNIGNFGGEFADETPTINNQSKSQIYEVSDPVVKIPITSIAAIDDTYIVSEEAFLNWGTLTHAPHYYFIFPNNMGGHNYLASNVTGILDNATNPDRRISLLDEFGECDSNSITKFSEMLAAVGNDDGEGRVQSISNQATGIQLLNSNKSALFNTLVVIACVLHGNCDLRQLMNMFIDEFSLDAS